MFSKFIRTVGMIFIGLPLMFLMLLLAGFFRLCTIFGFGHRGLQFVTKIMATIAVLRVQEILPYKYPVPDSYATPGHIRFTAIFSANARGEPLNPETQEPMMYMARVNFIDRLVATSPETIRQLEKALIARRIKTNAVFVFAPKEPARVANTIDFTKK